MTERVFTVVCLKPKDGAFVEARKGIKSPMVAVKMATRYRLQGYKARISPALTVGELALTHEISMAAKALS